MGNQRKAARGVGAWRRTTSAAIPQSGPARAVQCPSGALIAARPRNAAPYGLHRNRHLPRAGPFVGQNDGRQPAELAHSCGSMPHWGIDRCATPQQRASAPTEWVVKEYLAPEGSNGEERKSVKKRAALLHVLAFSFLDHLFGVLRGERLAAQGGDTHRSHKQKV